MEVSILEKYGYVMKVSILKKYRYITYRYLLRLHRYFNISWYIMICQNIKRNIYRYTSMIYYIDTHHDAGEAYRYISWCGGGRIDTYHDAVGDTSIYIMMRIGTHRYISWCGSRNIKSIDTCQNISISTLTIIYVC